MDTAQWPQKHVGIATQELGDPAVEKRAGKEEALKCPRCNSCNTKFCYYNNYSLTQPRYFCKTCRRYWTQGGTLRSVPVGGGSRKNKRSTATATSSSSTSSLSKKQVAITLPPPPPLNNYLTNEDTTYLFRTQNPSFVASSELSLGGSYVPTVSADLNNNVNNMFSSLLFPFQEFKPTLNYFAYDNHHHHQGLITNNGVHQEMKLVDGFDQINQDHQGADRDSIGLLNNGMLSAGGVWQL